MHHSLRSITSSEAKSNLSPPFAQPVDAGRLAFLALAYSKGLGRVINQIRSCDLVIPIKPATRWKRPDGWRRGSCGPSCHSAW